MGILYHPDIINYLNPKFDDELVFDVFETIWKCFLTPNIYIDYELKLSDIDSRFIKFLKYLEPFGPGNVKPIFSTKNLKVIGHPRLLGKEKNTLKFQVKGEAENYEVIGFNMVTALEKTLSQRDIDIAYTIEINKWQGKSTKQLVLKDIRFSNEKN